MSSTITYENRMPANFSEKVENFFRTSSENFYINKTGSGSLLNGPPSSLLARLGFPRDNYELIVEIPHFRPDEVTVSTQDELLIVSGKHEETRPDTGFQSREFTNKYTLPTDIDKTKMTCVFKERGYLKIEAPYIKPEEPNARTIPIKILNESSSSVTSTSNKSSTATTTCKTASNSSVVTNGTSVSHV